MDRLAHELLDEIFSHIGSPRHLLDVAYACKPFASLIIPRHIEYREVRADITTPVVWAHLARRIDLAKNVRSIRGSRDICMGIPHDGQPITLVDDDDREANEEDMNTTVKHMIIALRSMMHLKVSTWVIPAVPEIIREFSRMSTLEEYVGFSFASGEASSDELEIQNLNLAWHFPKLRRLQVMSPRLANRPNLQMSKLLRTSGGLIQELTISEICLNDIAQVVRLPNLIHVDIVNSSLGNIPPDLLHNIEVFLSNHPSIQELKCRRSGEFTFGPGVLPNLRRLAAFPGILRALEAAYKQVTPDDAATDGKLKIEHLSVSIGVKELNQLRCLNRRSLTGFHIAVNDHTLIDLKKMGILFPLIEWLSIPWAPGFTLIEALDALGRFKNLKRITTSWFYGIDSLNMINIPNAILQLASVCPKLSSMPSYLTTRDTNGELTKLYIMRKETGEAHPDLDLKGVVEVGGYRLWYEIRNRDGTCVFYDSREGTYSEGCETDQLKIIASIESESH